MINKNIELGVSKREFTKNLLEVQPSNEFSPLTLVTSGHVGAHIWIKIHRLSSSYI